MPADVDELLDRAARVMACEEPRETRTGLLTELEVKLDELAERWPDGKPPREDAWANLRFETVRSEIQNLQWKLEDGDYIADPRPALTAIRGGRDDA